MDLMSAGTPNSWPWARRSAAARVGPAVVVAERSQAGHQWASDHCHTLAGGTPILALDMYEHSYHMDFGAKAAGYVDTFMQAIRWQNADRLLDDVSKQGAVGRRYWPVSDETRLVTNIETRPLLTFPRPGRLVTVGLPHREPTA
jgi:Iron/manganese superoxide dismutases, C-terminal domain